MGNPYYVALSFFKCVNVCVCVCVRVYISVSASGIAQKAQTHTSIPLVELMLLEGQADGPP